MLDKVDLYIRFLYDLFPRLLTSFRNFNLEYRDLLYKGYTLCDMVLNSDIDINGIFSS